jgi:nitrous oxide reductase accessory protein NosL
MRTTAAVALAILVAACSSLSPVSIKSGDVCDNCGTVITNVAVAAEAVTANGTPLRFGSPECMAKYLTRHADAMAGLYVTDYDSGRLARAEAATFVRADRKDKPGERVHYAFTDARRASAFAKDNSSTAVDWLTIVRQAKAAAAD